ncbi:hypothetical protein ALQ16_201605 [Pseudomonas syringae pv. actinidiae]|nr:hypothetical protein ALQ16_201605 [Pseudomonas syringae pv. actinidiae]
MTAQSTRNTQNISRSVRSGRECASLTPQLILARPPTANGMPIDQLT